MPSVSAKQRRFMKIAAHDPEFAKAANISQTVAQEFFQADQAVDRAKSRRGRIKKAMKDVRNQP